MTNSIGSGILGFWRCSAPVLDFPQGLPPRLFLGHYYSKPQVCPTELLHGRGIFPTPR